MYYGHTLSLGRNFMGSRGDADAAAYVAAVVAAGGTVSGAQATAINDFYVSAKADSYYTSLKRLYLPIWGVAAANAIDMIGLTSGTFVGGVTHAAGYVQGNGSTGYFSLGVTGIAAGLTNASGLICALVKQAPSGVGFAAMISSQTTPSDRTQLYVSGNSSGNAVETGQGVGTFAAHVGTRATNLGIYVSTRESTTSLKLYSRKTSGFTLHDTEVFDNSSGSACANTLTAMASSGTSIFSDAQFGALGIGLGINLTHTTSFTLALKNLWETTTGLTLL